MLASGIATLWCPSDPTISQGMPANAPSNFATYISSTQTVYRNSYGVCMGIWLDSAWTTPNPLTGPNSYSAHPAQRPGQTAMAYSAINIRTSSRDHRRDEQHDRAGRNRQRHDSASSGRNGYNIWSFSGYNVGESGVVGSMYGVNPWKRMSAHRDQLHKLVFPRAPLVIPMSVGSFHPGGANVGMADGSVRFIKETIATFPNNALPSTNYATSGPGPYLSGYNTYGMFNGTRCPCSTPFRRQTAVKSSAPTRIDRIVALF